MVNHFITAFFVGKTGNLNHPNPQRRSRALFLNLRPLKGKRLSTFCASLALLQNVFAVHRFDRGAADWRSGK